MNSAVNKPFLEHLEELRYRIIKSILAIIFFSILGYFLSDFIIKLLIMPISDLAVSFQVLKITSIFLTKIGISIVFGFFISVPIILYQILKFILPAFENKITNYKIVMFIFLYLLLFIIGLFFGYYVLIPISITFFKSLSIGLTFIEINYTLENYLVYLIWILIIASLIFQLPFIIFLLNKLGLVNRTYLQNHRRHIIVLFFILAAIFTPPDPISQIIVVLPLYILFELSIFITKFSK